MKKNKSWVEAAFTNTNLSSRGQFTKAHVTAKAMQRLSPGWLLPWSAILPLDMLS
jgi:hypothetical protein